MKTESMPATDASFRDQVNTITKEGKRNWIYPKKPKGDLYTWRTLVSLIYIALFFTLPFIRVNGHPFFLLNIPEGQFILFGAVFWPHDFFFFGMLMITIAVFIILFTVVYGRIFCGWVCPQTIFMEMIFRKLEYAIEGDDTRQKALNKEPWNSHKIFIKSLKHSSFFILSFIIANTFLAYIIGTDALFRIMSEPLSQHVAGFISIIVFTLVFFFIYSWFREQACIIVCPYGRLQGVLLDKDSIVVAYDTVRGEPRTHFKKNEKRTHGDCIDCLQCVKVCPTGIDIRNGTQLECVNCTACIDACNFMMENVGLPQGLIRYASENEIKNKKPFKLTRKAKAYTVVLFALMGFVAWLLLSRSDIETTVLRTPGMLYQKHDDGTISNLYNLKIINKTFEDIPVTLKLESPENGKIVMVGKNPLVKGSSKGESEFFVYLPKKEINKRKIKITIGVYNGDEKLETVSASFMGPVKIN